MEIYHQYVKKRRQFGRWPKCVDEGAEMIADVRPHDGYAAKYIERNPVVTLHRYNMTPPVPWSFAMKGDKGNTLESRVAGSKQNINHEEGGWPKDVDCSEAEHTIRYRKKVEKDEDYVSTIVRLGQITEQRVKQNNAIDIYQRYYVRDTVQDVVAEMDEGMDHRTGRLEPRALCPASKPQARLKLSKVQTPEAKTLTVLNDAAPSMRPVSMVDWNIEGSKLVTAFADLRFQQQPPGMSLNSYVWDLANPNVPDVTLSPLSQCVSARFNLKDPNVIGAGLYSGQFAVFDVRKHGSRPDKLTPMDLSHTEPVYDFAWLQSKTGTELMTLSSDGVVKYWDIRMMDEYVERLANRESDIIEEIELIEKGGSLRQGGVSLGFNPNAGAMKFMVGTESGSIINCNRKGKDRVAGVWTGHHGPVYAVQRHPQFPKYFLSIGDWTARIWAEDSKQPLITTEFHKTYLTGGCWSNTRAGVFFTTRQDGVLDAWDLYYRHQKPSLTLQVSDKELTCVQNTLSGQSLAVGSAAGTISVLYLSQGMWETNREERNEITSMLEHEGVREKNLEKTIKEARLKAKKEAMQKQTEDIDAAAQADADRAVELEFFKATGLPVPDT